jgi:hypothetical protein
MATAKSEGSAIVVANPMAKVSLYLLVISIWELSSPKMQNGIFILKNNWSSLRYLRSDSVSQPVSAYKYSDFGKMGNGIYFQIAG